MFETRESAEELVGELFQERYQIQEELAASVGIQAFRARDQAASRDVQIKILWRAGRPQHLESYLEFQRRWRALEGVATPRMARVLALERTTSAVVLVEEFFSGARLSQLPAGARIAPGIAIAILGQIAEALEPAHRIGLYHTALSPSAVLLLGVEPDHLPQERWEIDAKVLDHGQSLLLERSLTGDEPAEDFAYISPERVGMLPYRPDGRADLYSLGIIGYRLLSGRLPFEAPNAGVYLHRVMATEAHPLGNLARSAPADLVHLIHGLFARSPDERPNSIQAFLEILHRIGKKSGGSGSPDQDLVGGISLKTPAIVEREIPLKRLRARLDLALRGEGSLLLVSGAAGDGKTRLVEELRATVESGGGLFLRTQANAVDQSLPFHAVRELVDEFLIRLRALPPERRGPIVARVEAAVGELGGGLLRILPHVREILSNVPELISLEPERERQRFITTVINFILSLAGSDQPLLLFFDDLHWVDSGSREIFEKLSGRIGRSHLLLVGAFCPGAGTAPVDADRLLMAGSGGWQGGVQAAASRGSPARRGGVEKSPRRAAAREEKKGSSVALSGAEREPKTPGELIEVEPLSVEGTVRLLQSVLELDGEALEGIPELVFERARGNLRFSLEIARMLVQDSEGGREGGPDVGRLRQEIPSSDARAIVLHRIERLHPGDREIFASAAVIGRKFPLRLLERVAAVGGDQVQRAIQRGLIAQVITPYSRDSEDLLYFVDSAVQEDLYQKVDPARRAEIHELLGDLLQAEKGDESRIFEVAYHHLRSANAAKAVASGIAAAGEACRAHANHQACEFYEMAIRRAGEAGIPLETVKVQESLGEAYELQGKYPEAERCYREVLDREHDPVVLARIWGKIGALHFRRGDNSRAIDHLTRSLESLGIRMPRSTAGVVCSIAWRLCLRFVGFFIPRRGGRPPNDQRTEMRRAAVRIYHSLAYAYYFIDILRCIDIHFRQLQAAEALGPSKELAQTYSDHGIVCSIIPWPGRALRYQVLGLSMRRAIGDEWGVGQSHGFLGICRYYRADWKRAMESLKESIRILERTGDQWELEAVYSHLAFLHRRSGDAAAAAEALDILDSLSTELKDLNFQAMSRMGRSQILCQRGELDQAIEEADRAIALKADNLTQAMSHRTRAQALLRFGYPDEALRAAREGAAVIRANHIRNEYVAENHVALAEALTADVDRILALGRVERRRALRRIAPSVRAAVWTGRAFPTVLGYALRVRGTFRWLSGAPRRALRDFERSRKVLQRQGARYELARTCLEAGRWLVRVGNPRGNARLDEAIELFQDLGARRDLEEARELRARGSAGSWAGGAELRRGQRSEQRQLAALFRFGRTAATILEHDRLLRRAIDLAIEVLGAERGFILLQEEGEGAPSVRAARDVSQRDLSPQEFNLNQEVIKRVIAEQRPTAASEELPPPAGARPGGPRPLRSILCVPLRAKDRPIGVIYVDNRLVKDLFRDPDIELLSAFAAQLSVAIENAWTYRKIESLNLALEEKVRERTSELLKAKIVAEKANLMKDEFLANMSHELRTPLNAVIALADILGEETFGPMNEKQKKYVGDITLSGLHLLSLINDILDLSKIEAGQMQLQLSDFDLNSVLSESLVMVKEKAAKRGVALVLDLDSSLPLVRADHRKIKQVVFNLLSNAVKFTEDGGRITISSQRGDGEVKVTVADTGIGIAEENLGKIFLEFQQIDSSLSRKYQGTGLGLALSKRFIELHRGRVWVESEIKNGSRFHFTLPMIMSGGDSGDPGASAAGRPAALERSANA